VATAAGPARRSRPSLWWLLGPVAVFLVTLVVSGFMFLRLLELGKTDAVVPVDGASHNVRVDSDKDRMIWVTQNAPTPDCEVREAASGERLPLHRVTITTTRDNGTGSESGRWRVDPGSGDLHVTCSGGAVGGSAAIGPALSFGVLLSDFAPWFVLAMLLSLVWIGWLVALVVKYAKRTEELPPPPAWSRPA